VRKDGTRFWANGMLMPLRDVGGRLRGFAKILRDNTAAKEQEDLLRNKRDLLAATLDSLPGVFYVFDSAGRFLRWNTNFERVTGHSAEEIARMTPLDLFRGDDIRHIEERIGEVFAEGSSTAEASLVTKSGERIPYFFTGSRFNFGGAASSLTSCLTSSTASVRPTPRRRARTAGSASGSQSSDTSWRCTAGRSPWRARARGSALHSSSHFRPGRRRPRQARRMSRPLASRSARRLSKGSTS